MNRDILELTTHCIRCGFCLEDCPTFTQTASELESPRGRIYLVRSALEGKLDWQDDVRPHLDRCLGCRACETACPSGVEYGAILEMARDTIANQKPNLVRKAFLTGTTTPTILRAQLAMSKLLPGNRVPGFISKVLSGTTAEADLPSPQKPVEFPELPATEIRGKVYLLEGCAMRVLYPRVHQATRRLLHRLGFEIVETKQGCCGALHAHNGDLATAKKMATELVNQLNQDIPLIVNSAGCGSTIKEYGHLMESPAGDQFAKRSFDLSEFLFRNGMVDLLKTAPGINQRVSYHDACHLSHGQKITSQPRELIRAIPNLEYVELTEALTCCGSAGIYNVVQPKLARELLDRKVGHIQESKAEIVATGNPGCHAWIAQGTRETKGAKVLHTAELLEAAFVGIEYFQ